MARELNFQGGNDVIKYQDTTNSLDLNLSVDGVPFDLSQLDSMTLKIGNSNGYLLQIPVDLTSITDPQSGNVSVHLDSDTMTKLVPDDYNLEVWVEINPVKVNAGSNDATISLRDGDLSSEQAIFPSDGNLVFTVDDNIKASDTDSINAYAVDEVWDAVKSWETDTAKSISTNLSSQLLDEIIHWQGDISEKLKNELLQDLANDESNIQKQLNDVLTQSLDDLINKEVGDAKQAISTDLHNAMVSDVANQISIIKPQVTDDLHNSLSSELSNELTQAIQNWENSTDNDLNNKLAQAIVDKTNTMQTDLSNQLTNYLAGKLSDYETNSTNTITANITAQLTQNLADQFNQEDSKIRADLEGLVKGQIQNDITNTLQQMQQNGDIYATKQQLTDFENQINTSVNNLALNNNNVMQWREDLPSDTDLNNLQTQGIYWFHGFIPKNAPLSDNNVGTITITVTGDCITQTISYISGNLMFYRTMNKTGWFNEWQRFATMNDINTIANQLNDFINKSDKYNGTVSDANEATSEGTYRLDNEAKNVPLYAPADSIFLHVWNVPGSNLVEQLFIPMWHGGPMNELWFRSFGGANWQPWQKIATTAMTDNLQNQINNIVDGFNSDGHKVLKQKGYIWGIDVNNINETGIYTWNAPGSPILNLPDGMSGWGTLVVIHDEVDRRLQIAYSYYGSVENRFYFRLGNGSWQQVASMDDLNTAINQLSNTVNGVASDVNALVGKRDFYFHQINHDTPLSNIKTPGIYRSDAGQSGYQDTPDGSNNFTLVVEYDGYFTHQTYFSDHVWRRDGNRNFTWYQIANSDDVKQLEIKALDGIVDNIIDNDLNSMNTPGTYFSTNHNIKNTPSQIGAAWFIIEVKQGIDMTFQTLRDWNNDVYVRILSGSPASWQDWKKLLSTKDTLTLQGKIDKPFDQMVETGIYLNEYPNEIMGMPGNPDGASGHGYLIVIKFSDSYVYQRFFDDHNYDGERAKINGNWNDWQSQFVYRTQLTGSGVDFNNLTKPGIYPISVTGQPSNTPNGDWRGVLTVMNMGTNGVTQEFFADDGTWCTKHYRMFSQVTQSWTPWSQEVTHVDIDTATNQLQNNINNVQNQITAFNTIPQGTDVLTINTGRYVMDGNPSWWKNMPPTWSWLNIITVNYFKSWSGAYVRTLEGEDADTGYHWYRTITSARDTGWQKISDSSNTLFDYGTITNVDLDQINYPGIYHISKGSGCTNIPEDAWAVLTVKKWGQDNEFKTYLWEDVWGNVFHKTNGNPWKYLSSSADIQNAQNTLQNNIDTVQNNVNNLQGNALQKQGVWQGQYWDWGSHADGIYIIDKNQNTNPLTFFTGGGAAAFSGWGMLTLTSGASGDRYAVLQDNVNHMFRNHLAVGSATFSGWIQY